MSDTPKTKAELLSLYGDKSWQEKLVDLLSLVSILRTCIIAADYRPSEELSNTIAVSLTDAGRHVRDQLARKKNVNPKDANVLTLLALVHVDPLIDLEAIDEERLAAAISTEVQDGSLRFPLIFGRDLYQKAASLFPEEREYLSHDDTVRLLEGQGQGVFHSGHYLLGPFGVVRTPHTRALEPRTYIPLQHCVDPSCLRVHRVHLSTSIEAGVNAARPHLNKVLEQVSVDPSDWNGFVADFSRDTTNSFAISSGATMPELLGDGFSDAELRTLLTGAQALLGDEYKKKVGALTRTDPLQIDPESFGRAELLHCLLTFDDSTLARLVDHALDSERIVVPEGEVRKAMVNQATRRGAWGLKSQLSRLGVRSIGTDSSLPLMKLSELARTLYDTESTDDMDELSWTLRSTPGATPAQKLETFLRDAAPSEVIDVLLLDRKKNAQKAAKELGVSLDSEPSELRDAMLWKLGFRLPRTTDFRMQYWSLHDDLESVAKTALVDVASNTESIRSVASNYFVALESFLLDSLTFATWALLYDHYSSAHPFTYFAGQARDFASIELNEHKPNGSPDEPDVDVLPDRPVLKHLVQGFAHLAARLEDVVSRSEDLLRDKRNFPRFTTKTDLQKFPFVHVVPFVDLTQASQHRIIETLRSVARVLGESGIMTARNGLLHAAQETPSVSDLQDSLTQSRRALDQLESIGCVRTTYALDNTSRDAWGHDTVTLRSGGKTVAFGSPSPYEWVRLPGMSKPQFLMVGAIFAEPNEMLRFSEGFESEFHEYWINYPRRPEHGQRAISNSEGTLESDSYATSRAG